MVYAFFVIHECGQCDSYSVLRRDVLIKLIQLQRDKPSQTSLTYLDFIFLKEPSETRFLMFNKNVNTRFYTHKVYTPCQF